MALIAFFIFTNQKILKFDVQSSITVWGVFIFFMLGISSFMMNRNINNKTPLLPGIFDIVLVIKDAVCMLIVMAPFSLIMYYALDFYNKNFIYEDEVILNYFFYFAIIFTCLPFIFVPTVLYSVRGNLFDAYRFDLIINAAGNFIIQAISFCFQFVFSVVLVAYLFYRIFLEMLGSDSLFIPIIFSFFTVLSFLIVFSYCSDLYIDVIPEIKI